jgi:predicted dehydrogenase
VSPDRAAPLRIGVVGLGYWGPNLVRAAADADDAEITWLCDVDHGRLSRLANRYPGARTTNDLSEILVDPEVDAVMIATPVFTHFELATRCLEAGKHTFVEKPLAPSGAEADELIRLARERDRVLMCGHTFIYSPAVRYVKGLLDDGELGDIFFLSSSRVNLGLHQRDVSVVWDLGPHDFSILLYWLEELPEAVRAVGRDSIVPGIADVAFVTLTFASGIVANVELSWLSPSKLRRTVVVGNRKMIVYEDGSAEPVKIFDHGVVYRDPETFGEYHLSYRSGDILAPKLATYEPLTLQLTEFAEACRAGAAMRWHVQLARDVVQLTHAADESLRRGGVEVPTHALNGDAPDRRRPESLIEQRR